MRLTIAQTVEDALHALQDGARPVAGGTDLVVAVRQGSELPLGTLVAIDQIAELRSICVESDTLRIGAAVTHAALISHPKIIAEYTAVADAAALIGSPATRHVGTIGGNVMNASPAMDTGAPLLVLDAAVLLASVDGQRVVPVGELWSGNRQTTANANELCIGIHIPPRPSFSGSAYVRLENRRAMEIAVVGAAAAVTLADSDTVATARVALTSVAPTIIEIHHLDVSGMSPAEVAVKAGAAARDQAQPISDLRASDEYRSHTIEVIARRATQAAARRAKGERLGVPINRSLGVGASP